MSEKPEKPPACFGNDPAFHTRWGHKGISERDFLAAMMLHGLLQSWGTDIGLKRTSAHIQFAEQAYELADALLTVKWNEERT